MATLATSKNLTVLGILTICGALVNAGLQWFQTKTVDLNVLLLAVSAGIGMILGKGAQNTGGSVQTPPAP